MKHPSPDQLAAYGLGKLLGPSADTVVAHLETCVDCRRAVASLSADSFVGRIQEADVESALGLGAVPPELANHPDYQVVCELGRGGMGVVYLARNTIMDRDEVLKVAHRALLEKPGASERFLQEIRSAAQLMHVNVVRAYSVLRLGDLLVFAMEYVPGDDLAKIVRKHGALPVAHACNYAAQVALGLQHAYEKGMVHRDIKPSNLILSKDGKKPVVKILDFGLAKMTSEVGFARDLTGSNKMMGTPDYIAPEQILDAAKADIRADIYSLGCTLYYLLAGSPPFAGGSLYEVLHAHSTASAKPLNLVRPEVPKELAAVVAKMLAKEPAKRYQTPGEVAKELQPFTKPGVVPTPPVAAPMAHPTPAPPKARRMTVGPVDARKISRVVDEKGPARFELAARTMLESPPNRARSHKPADKDRRAVWIGLGIAAMLGVVGLLALSVTLRFVTPEGTIVLENVPDGAEVTFDGKRVTVRAIPTSPGSHKVEVHKGGFKDFEEDVAVHAGRETLITIRLEPKVRPIAPPEAAPIPVEKPKATPPLPPPDMKPNPAPSLTPPQVVESEPKAGTEIVNSIGMKLVYIPAGKFMMGSPDTEKGRNSDEWPQHEVEITKGYYLGKYSVTQAEFKKVMGKNPSWFAASGGGKARVAGLDTSRFPVEMVTWADAKEFCRRLSAKEGKEYRLPTEAEWEYACRAGTKTAYHVGEALLERNANFGGKKGRPVAVGSYAPNAWGLCDMHGNVWQWCEDWYARDYYANSPLRDPKGPESGSQRARRGGGWGRSRDHCRASFRSMFAPTSADDGLGFRIELAGPQLAGALPPVIAEPKVASEIENAIGMKLAYIPAGKFMMGSPDTETGRRPDEGPQHEVEITKGFHLAIHTVTLGEFRRFTAEEGYVTEAAKDGRGYFGYDETKNELLVRKPEYTWRDTGWPQTDRHPVVNVTWNDAKAFCAWLSRNEKKRYGLPSEAQWEYACRAGTTTSYWNGDDPEALAQVGNVEDASLMAKFPYRKSLIKASDGYIFTAPVGQFRKNGFGLFDMHGNVSQWCEDGFDAKYYSISPRMDPVNETAAQGRVTRGSSWHSSAKFCRSAFRERGAPDYRFFNLGFRVGLFSP